jgi:hypothetical protein
MEYADFSFLPLNAWDDNLIDVSDIVEPMKSLYIDTALRATYSYNNVLNKRAYYAVPMKCSAVPFNIWRSLIEKAGYKLEDIPNTWDAFLDFFMPVQDNLRAKGMRNVYAYGYQLTANRFYNTICHERTVARFFEPKMWRSILAAEKRAHTAAETREPLLHDGQLLTPIV